MGPLRPELWGASNLGELYIGIWQVQCPLGGAIFLVSPCIAGPATHPHLSHQSESQKRRRRPHSATLERAPDVPDLGAENPPACQTRRRGFGRG